MAIMRIVLAHQGGWDEFLYFAVPAVLAVLAIRWAEKRARQRRIDQQIDKPTTDETTDHDLNHDRPGD